MCVLLIIIIFTLNPHKKLYRSIPFIFCWKIQSAFEIMCSSICDQLIIAVGNLQQRKLTLLSAVSSPHWWFSTFVMIPHIAVLGGHSAGSDHVPQGWLPKSPRKFPSLHFIFKPVAAASSKVLPWFLCDFSLAPTRNTLVPVQELRVFHVPHFPTFDVTRLYGIFIAI